MKRSILFFLLIANTFLYPVFSKEIALIEKKKEYNLSNSFKSSGVLHVNNQFGDVKIVFWNQKQVQAKVTVTANAPSLDLVENFLNSVNVTSDKIEDDVFFKTEIKRNEMSKSNWQRGKETNFRINYVVYMPNDAELDLTNSFGTVIIPHFDAPLSLNLSYCDLQADDIINTGSNLNLNFGSANIKSMNGGNFNANYTNVALGDAKNIRINNNHGNFRVKTLSDIAGVLNYSEGVLGSITEGVKLKLNYTNKLVIGEINDKIKNLELLVNYSDINLPVSETFSGNFDIKTTHGSFKINSDLLVKYLRNSESEVINPKNQKINISNFYQGKIGKNAGNSKIVIISNYGDVKIK